MGGMSAFLLLNKYAVTSRDLSMARALCQERIEQALTASYRPAKAALPAVPSSDPGSTAALYILGTASNYTAGSFNGSANYTTSTESIPVFTQSESTSGSSGETIYTRTTTVSPTTYGVVQFTVTVSFAYRGQTYSTSITTLRGSD